MNNRSKVQCYVADNKAYRAVRVLYVKDLLQSPIQSAQILTACG